jgi:hypothetical protein
MMNVHALNHDPALMDLVAHFLGIAQHHNINAAPSGMTALHAVQAEMRGDTRARVNR